MQTKTPHNRLKDFYKFIFYNFYKNNDSGLNMQIHYLRFRCCLFVLILLLSRNSENRTEKKENYR